MYEPLAEIRGFLGQPRQATDPTQAVGNVSRSGRRMLDSFNSLGEIPLDPVGFC